MSKSKLFLLDGMALAYRAHFAMINSNLRNAEGISTGPVFGFANTLERLLSSEMPTHIAVAWDTHAPTFRHKIDDQYKANRPPQPEELRTAIPLIKQMVQAYGIPNLELDGYEADDIIGTMARAAEKQDVDVYMVTPDKDFMQLVDEHVRLYKPMNNGDGFSIVGIEGVNDYFGVSPDKVIDVLALIGDTSDNIPGVPGVGKKTAPKLIHEYDSLENLLEKAPEMKKSKLKENLIEFEEQARRAKVMVTIHTQVPETPRWQECKFGNPDSRALAAFYERMQFRTLSKKYRGEDGFDDNGQGDMFAATPSTPDYATLEGSKVNYILITTENDLENWLKSQKEQSVFCLDTETTGTDPLTADLLGISLCFEPGNAAYIALNRDSELDIEKVRPQLTGLLANSDVNKVAQNAKYDMIMLSRYGLEVKGQVFDTLLAAYLIDANQKLSMDSLAERYLSYKPIPISDLIGKGRSQKSMDEIPLEKVSDYACEDADITLQLAKILEPKLQQEELEKVADEIEFPLVEVLADMEARGILLDLDNLAAFSEDLEQESDRLTKEIYDLAGEEFNLNSPKQMGPILFEKLQIPAPKKSKSGQYPTNEAVLSNLSAEFEIVSKILEYRGVTKLRSTYVDALPKLVDKDNRIHTSFNQHVAATGRLSSSNPNLQNIPIRTEMGRKIRKAFVARSGCKLISADYSQIELRVIASISGDENMIQAFKDGEDIHARTAKEIFGLKSIDLVEREHRRKAKEVNFGIPYGVSAFGLAQRLGIKRDEAKAIIDAYFDRFPAIQTYMSEVVLFANEHGYVKTLFGRKRMIPDINARNPNVRGFAERTAINTPIQGSAADLIKMAMIKLHKRLEEEDFQTKMLLQVHDELVFEAPEAEVESVSRIIVEEMEHAYDIGVPLKVESGVGANWLDAH